ncbi:DUF3987 domain-containing protein [Synechococcus sp. MIT S9507]|uniref:DUF3987 domain-containing protein n=1 Tax=Synechococcus sp. MIT S9507 TaxID=3082544 RepID=UPI0039B56321
MPQDPNRPTPWEELEAQIRELKAFGPEACLNGHRADAEQLLEQALEINFDHELTDWLFDQLNPISAFNLLKPEDLPEDTQMVPIDHWLDEQDLEDIVQSPEAWTTQARELLDRSYGQLEAFQFGETKADKDGEFAREANQLAMEWDLLDWGVEKGEKLPDEWYYAAWLHGQIEDHIDPSRELFNARKKLHWGDRCTPSKPFQPIEIEEWRAQDRILKERIPLRYVLKDPKKGDDFDNREYCSCVESVAHHEDWVKRGKPDQDAPLVKLNGKVVQADVSKMLTLGLEQIEQSGVGGAELTGALLMMATNIGQPFHSIKQAHDEYRDGVVERGLYESVLDDMLKGKEPMITVEELAGKKFTDKVVADFQKQFDADPYLVLLTVMTAIGSVLPLNTRVRGLSHTQHWRPGILFVMILINSGGKKSMLLDELVEKPIVGGEVGDTVRIYQKRAAGVERIKRAFHGNNHEEADGWKAAPEWLTDYVEKNGTPDKLMHLIGDFTGEGIDRNAMVNEQFPGYRTGFMLTSDGGRQLLGGDRYKSAGKGIAGSKYTQDKLKRAWDGKGPNSARGNKALERNYEKIRLCVLGFIQPSIYDEISSDEADDACGFWPRFLAYETESIQLKEGLTPAERREITEHSTFRRYLDQMYGMIHGLHKFHGGVGSYAEFTFSTQAENWWYPVQCQVDRESAREEASDDGVMGRLLAKLPALVVDTALLLHLIRTFGDKPHLLTPVSVSRWGKDETQDSEQMEKRDTALKELKSIPLETVQLAYKMCRQLMLRTAKQRNRAQGDGSGDRAQFLIKVQNVAMKFDPDQKGLPLGQLQRGWNGAYLKKNPNIKDQLYQAVGALADRGLGELQHGDSNNSGLRYRWIREVTPN